MPDITIALSSVPNAGKTTLFNRLTGSHQKVGNWSGVTVEKKAGTFLLGGSEVTLLDLPGTYAITPTSLEERVVRDFLLDTPPDLLLSVVDAGNLYRGLGLVLQLATTGIPMVIAVNMMDEARRQGIEIDFDGLSSHLGAAVIPISAKTGEGIDELKAAMEETLQHKRPVRPPRISMPAALEQAIVDLSRHIKDIEGYPRLDGTFVAARLLEDEESTLKKYDNHPNIIEIRKDACEKRLELERTLGTNITTACAQCRFNAARGLLTETMRRPHEASRTVTDRLDGILMHRFLGLPLFFLIMFLVFESIFLLSAPVQSLLGDVIDAAQNGLHAALNRAGIAPLLSDLVVNGILEGAGVVISFFPVIALFFIFLSLIEDTGYIARAAFLMDRLMHSLKLDGKAFVAILLGYGCNVPAIMGTRILSGRHNRFLTMLMVPFSLCTARLQVFLFLAAILFAPSTAPWVLFSLYVLSFLMVILVGLLFKPLPLGGEPEPFVLELPPYRLPAVRTTFQRAFREVRDFIRQATTLIVLGVIAVWALTHLPAGIEPGGPESLAGSIGQSLSWMFEPLGIEWRETVALLFGLVAKEVLIGAMALLHGSETSIATAMTPLQGLSFMVFALVYTPCVATLAVIRKESGSWKVALLSVMLGLTLGWIAAFTTYKIGGFLGFS